MSVLDTGLRLLVLGGLLSSLALIWWLDRPNGAWVGRLRQRLLLGVPWGTLVTITLVLGVYLGLQHGYADWGDPLTIPYISWSYLYPLGMLTAAFSHTGPGHLLGNLIGTIALAPLVEYAWGHYPRRRGAASFGSISTNPYVRAFVLFPVAVILVGFSTAFFHWGPLIGFSGVVFAFAGFALVRYPIVTVVALSARSAISIGYHALLDPIVTASPGPSFGGPWWAGIAVEGHVFGLILGAVLGALLYARREETDRPSALRLWVGTVIAGTSLTIWAIWWYGEGASFVLYRGVGIAFVLTVAMLFTAATRASERDLLPEWRGISTPDVGVSRRWAATMILVVGLSTMAVVAVPVNLTTVDTAATPMEGVEVREYRVMYAENVPNQNVPAIDISVLATSTNVTSSGVIVVNPDRHIWSREVSSGALAFFGYASVTVGGPTWERTVDVRRRGWVPTGSSAVYQVWLRPPDGGWQHGFSSEPKTATPVVGGRRVTIAPETGQFEIVVMRNGTVLGRAPVPSRNRSMRVGGIQFLHNGSRLVAVYEQTRITIAREEEYA